MSLDISFLDQITPDSVRTYLTGVGWKPSRGNNSKDRTLIFNCPYKKYAQVELPIDSKGRWYSQSIDQLIKHLAEIEKRDTEAVISDLQYPDSEIISYRTISPQTSAGTIPLGDAEYLIDAITETLKTSVCDVIKPSLKHKRIKCEATDVLLKKVHLGQTEHGSYVIRIICPLDAIQSEPSLFDSTPIMRQTTMHLMKVAFDLVEATNGNRIGKLIDRIRKENSIHRISVDTCNAISKTQQWDDCTVDLATRWAPTFKLSSQEYIPDKVTITPKNFSGIFEICNALTPQKGKKSELQTEEFIAVVDECKGGFNDQDQREGPVILKIFSTEGKTLKAKAVLSHELYAKAHQNHIEEKGHFVKVIGSLVSKGRSNEIIVQSLEPLIQ